MRAEQNERFTRIGQGTPCGEMLRHYWHPVALMDEFDPKLDPTATRYDRISHKDVIEKELRVMDATAIAFCRDNKIPIVVFDVSTPGNIRSVLEGHAIGTLVG